MPRSFALLSDAIRHLDVTMVYENSDEHFYWLNN